MSIDFIPIFIPNAEESLNYYRNRISGREYVSYPNQIVVGNVRTPYTIKRPFLLTEVDNIGVITDEGGHLYLLDNDTKTIQMIETKVDSDWGIGALSSNNIYYCKRSTSVNVNIVHWIEGKPLVSVSDVHMMSSLQTDGNKVICFVEKEEELYLLEIDERGTNYTNITSFDNRIAFDETAFDFNNNRLASKLWGEPTHFTILNLNTALTMDIVSNNEIWGLHWIDNGRLLLADTLSELEVYDGKTIEKIDGYQYVTNDRAAWVKSEYCNNVIVFDDQWKKNALQIYHK